MPDKVNVKGSEFSSGNVQISAQAMTTLMVDQVNAPIGLTTVIDEAMDRQVFIAAIGLPEPLATLRETPLSRSFCRIVKATDAPLIVNDARDDDRVRDNPIIQELSVLAYLGFPLRSSTGEPLGSVCVIDTVPRVWSDGEKAHVRAVAEAINSQITLQTALLVAEEARRQSEAANLALVEANQRFQDLADNVPGAIFRYVEHPSGQSEIEFMSPGCIDIWELTPEEFCTSAAPMWEMIVPEDLPAMTASVQRSADTLLPWHHRWRIRTASQRTKWLDGYGQPRRADDGTLIWNSLILDVTQAVLAEQKSAETLRVLYEAGKQDTIGKLAGGIAHDFNNLLTVVGGNAELLIDPTMNVDRAALGRSILKAADLGAELTKRLISFARKADLHPSPVDVNKEVANLRDVLRSALPASISFEIALANHLPAVFVDRSFLESSLLNLALNARDAIVGKGAITIETAFAEVTEEFLQVRSETVVPGPYVMVAVTDTGEGMSPEILSRIFEPFFTTKSASKGSGLGLPMVEGFVRQSGGIIRVYSELGHGTSFRLYLPVLEGTIEEETRYQSAKFKSHSGPAIVLLVEDQAEVRKVLRTILASDGHTVLEAGSGDEGLEIFMRHKDEIEIVVSDVVMPGRLQGPEMVGKIREYRTDLPIIFVSGYPHEANVHGNGVQRTDLTLTKPVARDTLRAAVARALRRSGVSSTSS